MMSGIDIGGVRIFASPLFEEDRRRQRNRNRRGVDVEGHRKEAIVIMPSHPAMVEAAGGSCNEEGGGRRGRGGTIVDEPRSSVAVGDSNEVGVSTAEGLEDEAHHEDDDGRPDEGCDIGPAPCVVLRGGVMVE